MTTIVNLRDHEPEGEAAQYLLELAEKDDRYNAASDVQALRGETLAKLSFQVPDDIAAQFEKDRAEKWPEDEDVVLVDDDNDPGTPPKRRSAAKSKE